MSTLSRALAGQRVLADDAAWSLLRAQNAPIIVAVLGEHLGGENRRLPAPELFERIDADLDELRDHGIPLPGTAQSYCADWLRSGYLVRRASDDSRTETYELSQKALEAVTFLEQLIEPRRTVTESRLATIIERLRSLDRDTDPDVGSKISVLEAERHAIEQRIDRLKAGHVDTLPPAVAAERALDIISLTDELPTDFARVRAELESINRALRERLIDSDESHGAVLDNVFRGVDFLAESDAGRSFSAFYTLILDPEQSENFDDNVDHVLRRTFTEMLPAGKRRSLRRLLRTLQEQSTEVHDVMTSFTRSLRRFVQTQQFHDDRVMKRMLREAQRDSITAGRHIQPFTKMPLELDLSSVSIAGIGAVRLHNPADHTTTTEVVSHESHGDIDIEALRELARESEIDFAELTDLVNSTLGTSGEASVSDVLAIHPASQGAASVVGLLVLAEKHGLTRDMRIDISWQTAEGSTRTGIIPDHLFTRKIP